MSDVDVIVIGSGSGGLTAALGCALAGRSVLVLEQHYLPGGWCHSFPLGGYEFSPGVHYIGDLDNGGMSQTLYEGLGLAKHITWMELNPDGFDHVRLGDGFSFDIPKGLDAFEARLIERFPGEADGIRTYLRTLAAVRQELMVNSRAKQTRQTLLGSKRVAKLAHTASLPLRVPNLTRWGFRPLAHLLDHCVSDPHLRAVLTVQIGDHGLPPSVAPTVIHAAVAGHYFDGGFYPKGGGKAIPRAYLRELKAAGAEVRLSTEVTDILVESGRAVGVRLGDGSEVRANAVISNADPALTFGMLPTDAVPRRWQRKLEKTRYSLSNLSLFCAVDMDLAGRGFDSGNYWYNDTTDIEGTYARARRGEVSTDGCFATITSLKDRTKQQGSVHTVELFCLVGTDPFKRFSGTFGNRPPEYDALKSRLTEQMLDLGDRVIPGLSDHLVFQELGTPSTNRYYVRSTDGHMYGTEKTLGQIGPFAHRVASPIEGLYLCGASTMSHGVIGAAYSGLVAACKATGARMGELLSHKDADIQILPADSPEAWPEKQRKQAERARTRPQTARV